MKPHHIFNEYLITEDGKVISAKYKELREIKANPNNRNYLMVQLRKNNKTYNRLVHRLVAETFIPNDKNLKEVDHIDGNTQNNNVTNLQWVSPQQNTAKANAKSYKVMNVNSGEIFLIHNLRQWCKQNNLFDSGLYHTKNGKISNHKGWKLLETI